MMMATTPLQKERFIAKIQAHGRKSGRRLIPQNGHSLSVRMVKQHEKPILYMAHLFMNCQVLLRLSIQVIQIA